MSCSLARCVNCSCRKGKTFTMGGGDTDLCSAAAETVSEDIGIIPLAVQEIFQKMKSLTYSFSSTTLHLSYLEIYKEECFDLLAPGRPRLDIRDTIKGETAVDGLTCRPVTGVEDVNKLLMSVAKLRATGKTAMNAQSSRSHAICTFYLKTVKASSSSSSSSSGCISSSKVCNFNTKHHSLCLSLSLFVFVCLFLHHPLLIIFLN